MTGLLQGEHVGDDAHVRFLDGECEADERMAIAQHLAHCGDCARRLEALRDRSAALTRLLDEVDGTAVPARSATPRSRGLRRVQLLAAAAVVVLALATAAVPPMRAWIVERSVALWSIVAGGPEEPLPAPGPIGAEQTTPFASVSFAVAGDRLTVDVARRQAAGVLVVETTDADAASAAITGGDLGGDLLVLPGRLRIANAPASTASYRIRVPSRLSRVDVLVAGEQEALLEPRRVGGSRIVELGPVAARR